ncbi:GNAT family N-acetyltransferase [Proteiniborus sp. MB09-C3]|uniref:lipid II:glycine glycyltransferase FemX n=1 Tax=Proteiniborus sp. MB09-C3 TaxID=3050072 RepID=UPI0025551DFE|nr:GNAT family N-acetyltransferase [Proteiniborus sp. MB09-C3]WIV12082.1 GNAT family N-acetyltransferase [Proteiniborus sp. MB09-C3]
MRSKLDIYFKESYGRLYEEKDKNVLEKYTYCSKDGEISYMFLKREISTDSFNEELYDITTPYGYGGPIIINYKEQSLDKLTADFNKDFEDYCKENNIVSEFIRFHPLVKNHIYFDSVYDISLNRKTIYIDLTSEEAIWDNMKLTSRNRIRKAKKNNINVEEDTSDKSISKFIELYYKTMDKNSADSMYYFDKSYFYKLINEENNSSKIFNAIYDGKTISSMLILIGDEYIHYHLGATDPEYYSMSPNNILFFEVARWGCKNGYKKFHLGGGYSGPDDSLLRFKKTLNENGEIDFYLGKKIRNQKTYDRLVEKHMQLGKLNGSYFPLYRSPVIR